MRPSAKPNLNPDQLKVGTPLVLPWGTSAPILVSLCLYVFELEVIMGQTERQSAKTCNATCYDGHTSTQLCVCWY